MVRLLVLGIFITGSAFADYTCQSGNEKLIVKHLEGNALIQVIRDEKSFEGILNPVTSHQDGLYRNYDYDLSDEENQPGKLQISIAPRFGRGCGRACQKALPLMISAKLTFKDEFHYYACH